MNGLLLGFTENHRKYSQYLIKNCQTDVPIYTGDIEKIINLIKKYLDENDNIILDII